MPMSKISQFLVEEILKEESKISDYIVVYSGRFQPFHKGHYATYDHLVKKFGKDNVFIGTSNKTDDNKSPFNFKQKKSIMQTIFGIPSNKIVEVKNPYAPTEILEKFNENTTAFISVIGEKDELRLGGKYFKPYKGKVEVGYKDRGYVYVAPSQSNPISGTEVRNWLSKGTDEQKKEGFLKAYPKFNQKIFDLLTNKLTKKNKNINEGFDIGDAILLSVIQGGIGVGIGAIAAYVVNVIGDDIQKIKDWWKRNKDNSQIKKIVQKLKNDSEIKSFIINRKREGWEDLLKKKLSDSEISYLEKITKDKFNEEVIIETSSIGYGADDGEPETGYVSDGQKRVLDGGKPEPWFKQGSYKQIDIPKGDYMRGKGSGRDTETQFRKVYYKVKNVEQSTLNPVEKPEGVEKWKKITPKKKNIIKKEKRYWELEEAKNIISQHEIDLLATEMFEALGLAMGYPSKEQLIQKQKERDALRKKMNKQGNYYTNVEEEKIPGGLAKGKTLIDLAKKWDPKGYYDPKQYAKEVIKKKLKQGIKVEMEHTTDIRIATEIAMDHLWEDINYYDKLSKIEKNENIVIPVKVGDTVLMGKFKNKKVVIKTIGKDEHGMPTINGKKATTFRMINESGEDVLILTKSLGLQRKDMPQIKSNDIKDYLEFLKNNGIGISAKSINVSNIKMTQRDINVDKVRALLGIEKSNLAKPVIISNDGYILDGHHRVIALFNLDKNFKLKTIQIDLGIKELLKITKQYPKVTYKNIDEYVMYKTGHIMPAAPFRGMGLSDEDLADLEKNKNEEIIKEDSGSDAFPNDGNATTGKTWNSDWDDYDNQGYYLDGLPGWKTTHKTPSEFEKKNATDQTLPIHNHVDDKTSKYSRINKFGFKTPNEDLEELSKNQNLEEISNLDNQMGFLVPDMYFEGEEIGDSENLDLENPQGWESFDKNQNKFKKKISEAFLFEGGAYGHMNHPFDIDVNLTFRQLKDIVKKALTGKLELTREKTDGQALSISWVNGRLVAARNKSHLKNKGKEALDINGLAEKFANRGTLTDAYNFAMKDLSVAIGALTNKQKEKIFKGGSSFMNIEVIYPENANVIPYGQALLVFHGSFDYDIDGNVIGEDTSSGRMLAGMIKQINQNVQSKYSIQGPPITKLPQNKELEKLQPKYLAKINKLQGEFKLSDNSGISDYHQAWWTNFIDKKAKKLDAQQKIGLVKRWAFLDKGFRIKDIKDDKIREWAEGIDKGDQQKISKENIMKFEEIFLGVGADILSFMSSVLTVNPDSAKRAIVTRLEKTIKDIEASGDPKKIEKLKLELQRLESLGGFDKIVPTEGIVFSYNNFTMKLTGAFAPLNQLLGIMYNG